MKQFIDKLIERLEEEHERCINRYGVVGGNLPATEVKQCMEIINQFAEEYNNDFCEWKFTKSVADGGYFYSSGCNHKRFSDLHSFEFCPYCGKKIKVVE